MSLHYMQAVVSAHLMVEKYGASAGDDRLRVAESLALAGLPADTRAVDDTLKVIDFVLESE